MAIKQYSATAANNTAIDGTPVSDAGMFPNHVPPAIRKLMADLKEYDDNYEDAVAVLTVTANGSTAYNFDSHYSGGNPGLYATAGTTIAFDLSALAGSHPFQIETSGGTAYNTGLVHIADNGTVSSGAAAQGKTSGLLYWRIPGSISGEYAYKCTSHSSMTGKININTYGTLAVTTLVGPGTMTIDPAPVNDAAGTVVVAGNLQVEGTTTTIDSTTIAVSDKLVTLASGSTSQSAATNAGVEVDIGGGVDDSGNPSVKYDGVTDDRWEFNRPIHTTGSVTATGFSGSGANLTSLNASNVGSGTLHTDRLPTDISVTGTVSDTNGDVRTPRAFNISAATTITEEGVYYCTNAPTLTLGSGIKIGTIMTVYNNSTSAITLNRGTVSNDATTLDSMRIAADNDNSNKASVTLGARSTTTITCFISENFVVVSGTDVS